MTTEDFKRKLTAILSADVVGYSRLMGDDEAATVKTLETYKGVMFSLIKQHRGRVVDSPGDNLLAEFGSVVDAVQCAVSIQKELQTRNADLPENRRMEFRIGINLGDVIEEDDRIYGDGVNIAARLEAIADPGGICISKTAFDYIENKLPFGYRFIGEQAVKNIAKPIGAYKVLMETRLIDETEEQKAELHFWKRRSVLSIGIIVIFTIAAVLCWNFYLRGPSIEPASVERMAYPLPDKPSIAVLPFDNLSGDSEQDYIGDGLCENIISALSVSSEIFVIARNSTFTYKGKPVKVQQVAEDLGVQYVLEGSIQKSGDRLRITAQLIDAISGHHLWAEVYDREMKDLFDLQDEITKEIVGYLYGELSSVSGEEIRLSERSTDNLEAWINYIKGIELFNNFDADDNIKSREHFEAAIKADQEFVAAWTYAGATYFWEVRYLRSASPDISLKRASEFVQNALELDKNNPQAHAIMGEVYLNQKQYEKAITMGKRAIILDPNYALGHYLLGVTMFYSGWFDEAISLMERACRLDPNHHPIWANMLSESYIYLGRYEEALEVLKEMEDLTLSGRLRGFEYYLPLLSSWIYQELGRSEEARAYMAEALKSNPNLSLESIKDIKPFKNPAYLQRELDAHRKAGMPEHPPGAVQEKPSIAVLPFDNLSSDSEQEYFVAGLSEEILNSLTQIPGLGVTARTSSFAFKGTDKTVPEIASILGVDHILEGSVRKSDNTLRINAQLIRSADGLHLWSEAYDRELKDIFKIQEDIANNVADKLKLTLEAFNLLGGTENIKAYEFYLKSKAKKAEGTLPNYKIALELIDAAIDLDPEFSLAWAHKAELYLLYYVYGLFSLSPTEIDAGLKAAQKAIEIEPNLGDAYIYLGYIKHLKGELLEAEENFSKAMEILDKSLSSDHYFIIPYYHTVCKIKRSYELLEIIRRNDPINQTMVGWYYLTWGLLNDRHRAEEEYKGRNKLMTKSDAEWHDDMMTLVRIFSGDELSRDEIISSRQINITLKEYLASPEKGLSELIHIYNSYEKLAAIDLAFIAGWATYFGDFELAMEVIEKKVPDVTLFWFRKMHEVRQTSRFKEYIGKIGLVDYWKKYGWPALCHPVNDDFVCD